MAKQRERTRLRDPGGNGTSVPTRGNRDRQGRFLTGNAVGKGHGRPREDLRHQIRACVTDDDLKNIMSNVILRASKGSERHARLVLEYAIGRPAVTKDATPINVVLPACASARQCVEANAIIFKALSAGTIDLEAAQGLAALVQSARQVIETVDLERRLEGLEELLR